MALPDDYAPMDNTQDTRGLTPEMIANKWQPGHCPNPNGRPKGSKNRTTIAREILEMQHASGQTYEYASTKAVAEKAAAGDVMAWEKIMDAGYGKLSDKVVEVKPETLDDDMTDAVLSGLTKEQIEEALARKRKNNGEQASS